MSSRAKPRHMTSSRRRPPALQVAPALACLVCAQTCAAEQTLVSELRTDDSELTGRFSPLRSQLCAARGIPLRPTPRAGCASVRRRQDSSAAGHRLHDSVNSSVTRRYVGALALFAITAPVSGAGRRTGAGRQVAAHWRGNPQVCGQITEWKAVMERGAPRRRRVPGTISRNGGAAGSNGVSLAGMATPDRFRSDESLQMNFKTLASALCLAASAPLWAAPAATAVPTPDKMDPFAQHGANLVPRPDDDHPVGARVIGAGDPAALGRLDAMLTLCAKADAEHRKTYERYRTEMIVFGEGTRYEMRAAGSDTPAFKEAYAATLAAVAKERAEELEGNCRRWIGVDVADKRDR